jgi:arabinogalactan endo-1,4-beta-galactosidase
MQLNGADGIGPVGDLTGCERIEARLIMVCAKETAMRRSLRLVAVLGLAALLLRSSPAQTYAIGADASFLAKCEQDGVVFKENGQPKDVLAMLREHHYNWVRLRIFHDPAASNDKLPNDLNYTLALAKRAKAMGFHLLLDLHYSDTWADPGKQFAPAAWTSLGHKRLAKQVFEYTRETVAAFAAQGVLPDMVQVGNEVTYGMLWPDGKLPANWDNFADLVKAGVKGVKAGRGSQPLPRIMIHIERSGDYDAAQAFFDNLLARHVRCDVIGLSYYPYWHGDMATMRGNLSKLAQRYHRPVMVVETAYNWTPGRQVGKSAEFQESPEGQLAFLRAVDAAVRAVPDGLGQGVFWWEPAAEGGLRDRSFFDNEGNVLPVITAFDTTPRP